MYRILVTGCAGFIGSHLSETLLKKGYKVVGVDNLSNGKLTNIQSLRNNKNFNFLKCDVGDKEKLSETLSQVDIVYHLAALADIVPSIKNPDTYFHSNVNSTFNLVESNSNRVGLTRLSLELSRVKIQNDLFNSV